ncbi:Cytochrome P450 81Q32 [Linum grandiflorum]
MEITLFLSFLVLFTLFIILARNIFKPTKISEPPSPPRRPITGHLHLLKPSPLHRALHHISQTYGDIFSLRFGTRKVLVISSPSLVEECFTKNDLTFANRPSLIAGKHLNYNSTTMGFSSYGDHWRSLRRLTTIELFSTTRINSFSGIRTDEVRLLLKKLFGLRGGGGQVNLTEKLLEVAFNVVMRMIAGKRYYGGEEEEVDEGGKEFQDIIKEMEALRGSSNFNDYIPVLRWVDYGGVEKKMMKLGRKMDGFLQNLVDEQQRLITNEGIDDQGQRKTNLIRVLLSLRETEPEFYTDQTIKGIILTTVTAGTQTSAATLEWAMSLLLNNPEKMDKAFSEMESIVGSDHLFDESDIPKMNYLHNIINESHRLFPPTPLLLPHESSTECKVGGFDVARGTMLLVNTWSMNRDPKLWDEPDKFVPERFEGGGGGEGFKLLPFGAGRRACPGAGLAKRVVALTLGAMIQSFRWERVGEEEIDMKEGSGLSMPKALPLEVICRPREEMVDLLKEL